MFFKKRNKLSSGAGSAIFAIFCIEVILQLCNPQNASNSSGHFASPLPRSAAARFFVGSVISRPAMLQSGTPAISIKAGSRSRAGKPCFQHFSPSLFLCLICIKPCRHGIFPHAKGDAGSALRAAGSKCCAPALDPYSRSRDPSAALHGVWHRSRSDAGCHR